MAKNRFTATSIRKRIQSEGRASAAQMRKANKKSIRTTRKVRKATGPKQTVEEYLAAGGTISMCPPGSAASVVDDIFAAVTRRPKEGN